MIDVTDMAAVVAVPRVEWENSVNDPTSAVPLTFVVGTGRCGSTALSDVVNHHPEVLSLSEMLTSLGTAAIPDVSLSGKEFWEILSQPHPVFNAMIRGGVGLPEFLYPRSPGRFSADTTGIPSISMIPLPHLTDDPDGLFDELIEVVPRWPTRPAAAQYETLFAWLSARFGRRVVVERSGYSLHWVPKLRARFPHARFVHLFRNGPDCALSMSGHPGLRVILLRHRIMELLGIDSMDDLSSADIDTLPPELSGIFPDRFDPAAVRQPLPLTAFGRLWSKLIRDGLTDLAEVPESSLMSLSFENLLDDPRTELVRLADFVGIDPTQNWLDTASALLDRSRQGSAARLPADEFARLSESCAPGTRVLAKRRG